MGRLRRREIRGTAIMEVRQVAGVQTRARALAMAAKKADNTASPSGKKVGAEGMQISRLQLRRPRRKAFAVTAAVSAVNSAAGGTCPGGGNGDHRCCISGGSSIASCEPVVALENKTEGSRSGGAAVLEDVDDATSADCDYNGRLERWQQNVSKAAGEFLSSSSPPFPLAAEIEEFFLAAETRERQRFADKYNYDVVKDVPIKGRYKWLPSSAP